MELGELRPLGLLPPEEHFARVVQLGAASPRRASPRRVTVSAFASVSPTRRATIAPSPPPPKPRAARQTSQSSFSCSRSARRRRPVASAPPPPPLQPRRPPERPRHRLEGPQAVRAQAVEEDLRRRIWLSIASSCSASSAAHCVRYSDIATAPRRRPPSPAADGCLLVLAADLRRHRLQVRGDERADAGGEGRRLREQSVRAAAAPRSIPQCTSDGVLATTLLPRPRPSTPPPNTRRDHSARAPRRGTTPRRGRQLAELTHPPEQQPGTDERRFEVVEAAAGGGVERIRIVEGAEVAGGQLGMFSTARASCGRPPVCPTSASRRTRSASDTSSSGGSKQSSPSVRRSATTSTAGSPGGRACIHATSASVSAGSAGAAAGASTLALALAVGRRRRLRRRLRRRRRREGGGGSSSLGSVAAVRRARSASSDRNTSDCNSSSISRLSCLRMRGSPRYCTRRGRWRRDRIRRG